MLFNSYIFVFLFLPVSLILYYTLHRFPFARKLSLLGMSLWFYGYFHPAYILIIISSICVNYFLSVRIRRRGAAASKKRLLVVGLFFNVGLLFYFKYMDFFISNANLLLRTDFNLLHIALPLGISFFTFQQISYVADTYHGETPDYSFIDYATYVSFFPQLVAGPIVLHNELIPQIQDDRRSLLNPERLYQGIAIFAAGLTKKVILADTFGKAVTWGFSEDIVSTLTAGEIAVVLLAYTLQIYFDFSAYSDMAIGIARMYNIDLPINFDSPYQALSIPEFWKRWHLTLTRFLRKYIYFPLGGSKRGTFRTYRNILLVFLISGIWHGANWTFVLWGGIHGILNCATRALKKPYEKLHAVTQWLLTFAACSLLWLLFRADSVGQWLSMVKRLLRFEDSSVRQGLYECFYLPETPVFYQISRLTIWEYRINNFSIILWMGLGLWICLNCRNLGEQEIRVSGTRSVATMLMLAWCILSFSGVSAFIYFNF